MMLADTQIRPQPHLHVLLVALMLLATIGALDYTSGPEYSFFVFYAAPVLLVAWRVNRPWCIGFGVLSAAVWWWANVSQSVYQTTMGFVVAALTRLFYLVFVAIGGSAVKDRQALHLAHIESLKREQRLEREILRTTEREYQRIGRDLHDTLGPQIAAIGIAARSLAGGLQASGHPELAKAEQMSELLREAGALTRDLARGIFPIQMDGTGLSCSLEDLAHTTTRLTGVSVAFEETGNVCIDDPEVGMHLYRIAREALNNALVHGQPTHALIALALNGNQVVLTISDNGKGMDEAATFAPGMGLSTMNYRAKVLGGELKIDSWPEEGTVISCRIPLRSNSTEDKPS